MTALATSLRASWGRVSLRVALAQDTLALAALAALVALLAAVTWQTWGDLGRDTGYDLVAGARVAHGQLPYVDYIYYYGPLAPFLLGFAYLFAGGLAPAIALGFVVALAIVGATYALARTQTGPIGAFLASVITVAVAFAPNNLSFVLPHTYASPLGLLCALLFVLAAHRLATRGERAWAVATGAAVGLALLTRPEFALAVVVAAALWMFLRRRAGIGVRRELLLVGLPAAAIPVAVYGPLLAATSPHRLLLENLYPVETMRAAGNAVLRVHAPLTAGSFATLGVRFALYALGCAALVVAARVLGRRAVVGAAVFGFAALAVLVADPEAIRSRLIYAYGWIPAGAVLAVALLVARPRRKESWTAGEQTRLLGAVVLAVVGATTYAAFFLFATRPQVAVYAAPFAAVFLARLHLRELARVRGAWALGVAWLVFLAAAAAVITAKDARAKTEAVDGAPGTMLAAPEDARAYESVLARIDSTTRPGESILLAPQLTALYALSGRTDPLPEISLLPGALPDASAERRAIATLERKSVRLVVTDGRRFTEYGHTSFGGSFDRLVAAWVKRNFTAVSTATTGARPVHKLVVWVRRSS